MLAGSKVILAAITLVKEREWRNLLIHTNCISIPSTVNNSVDCPWEAISIMQDIKLSLNHFENCNFGWLPGERKIGEAHDLSSLWL